MSLDWTLHLVILPVLLPLLSGAVLATVKQGRHRLKFALSYGCALALLGNALALAGLADGDWPDGIGVYFGANWAAPFGIALVADRLSAAMLVLTALLALAALHYAQPRWSRIGVHFHSLFQLLLMGINGAFLTHDLFNLFVFFEVMLAASYGLVLHGYNAARLRASLQYIAVNLVAALFFLVGVALIYATTGTLNMADMAGRIGAMAVGDIGLLKTGVAVLALAFLVKSAMWPLGFWLPTTYAAASPPVTVMLVLMTKVGTYVVLRIWLLAFPESAGEMAHYGYQVLLWGGMATIVFGAAGMLATDTAGRLAGYAAVVSSGTLLAVIGYGQASLVTAGLYYFVVSTVALTAFVLLIELIDRIRTPAAALLALTAEAYAVEDTPAEPKGKGVPAAMAFLSLAFAACALTISGLPPLSGFVAKFGMFHALLNPEAGAPAIAVAGWTFMALVFVSGLIAIVSLMRFGVRTFWTAEAAGPPRLHTAEVMPVAALLTVSILLTVQAEPIFAYLDRASADIHRPALYIDRVLGTPPVPGPIPPAEAP
ncbi:monovalent cation/H+ antiporter subunit D [Massilia sp. H6]|uniref:monovalent cation/H+ antiporter subunit D n=1 Tax=Massilia sp. H6 TaxID=2970464 RepID=UPI002168C570|nr:monovalent cation/H+ antiporter subunit D [Massilia sp. H6]UVW28600.1 monovalent cation/H+ antiporter subunit D [Massilia sp. H6]